MSCATTGKLLGQSQLKSQPQAAPSTSPSPFPSPSPPWSHYRSLRLLNCCHLSIAIHQFIKRLHSQFNDRPDSGQTQAERDTAPEAAQTTLRTQPQTHTHNPALDPTHAPSQAQSQQTALSSECSQRFLQIIIIILLYRHEVVCIYQKRRVQVESFGRGSIGSTGRV